MPLDLGYRPRAWQRKCHLEKKRFTVLALHRRAGKTELAIMELVNAALSCRKDLALFAYVSPFLKQSKAVVWDRLKARLEPLRLAGAVDVLEGELAVRFRHNGATLRLFGADNPDALRGVRLDGIVLDEVAQIKPEFWEEVVRPALADREGWALFIGTPKGLNLFSKLYFEAEGKQDWARDRFTVYDTDALPEREVAAQRESMSALAFAREYLCDFSAAGDDQVISLAEVEEAARRAFKPGEMDYAPVILGVDVARFGDDRSVIQRRQGLQAFDPIILHGIDNMALAGRVAVEIARWKPEAVFVDSGNGSGVIDRLRQLGHAVVEVNFGGKAADASFSNKGAEMLFAVKDWLAAGGAIPDDVQFKQDLSVRTYWFDASNRIVLEPKADVKKRGMPSPDLADALGLTFAHPVAKREVAPPAAWRGDHAVDYDPLTRAARNHTSPGSTYDPLSLL